MTCSSIAEAISNFCDVVEPLAENAALACSPLAFVFPEAPGLVKEECIAALGGLQAICGKIGQPAEAFAVGNSVLFARLV
jgi:hypothetical protein